MDILYFFSIGQWLLITGAVLFSLYAATHAIIHKRHNRAAFGWVSIIILPPILVSLMYTGFGPFGVLVAYPTIFAILYFLFGINHLPKKIPPKPIHALEELYKADEKDQAFLKEHLPDKWKRLIQSGNTLGYSPLNHTDIQILDTGDDAYPAMLDAINKAEKSISLYSYIFSYDDTGKEFINALSEAQKRNVDVRVLLDAVGSNKKLFNIISEFKNKNIEIELFLPI